MNSGGKRSGENKNPSRVNMTEARQDLEESKRSVRELLQMRRALYKGMPVSQQEVQNLKEKAIDAINHLFEDEMEGDC